jgi:hypothetical protein
MLTFVAGRRYVLCLPGYHTVVAWMQASCEANIVQCDCTRFLALRLPSKAAAFCSSADLGTLASHELW